jgi:hypothetical protein
MAGTMNMADLYGKASQAVRAADPVGVGGPNQSSVTNPPSANMAGNGPAISWLGFVLLLVLLRIAIEMKS